MNLTRCANGHYYDAAMHRGCPHCGVQNLKLDFGKTQAKGPPGAEILKTERKARGPEEKNTPSAGGDGDKTVGLIQKQTGINPVVGWLVCVQGREKGKDYRIRSEKNYLGRSSKMDICIRGDETISRENHAIIVYNPKTNTFRLHPGEGRGLVYLNGEEVFQPAELNRYDLIELGETKLAFIPFCGEAFQWTEDGAGV